MQLTDRDREIVRLVGQHRFLRSSHICALLQGSEQQLLRRLKLLYHHGYLERPRAQIDYYYKGGSREIVYGLGTKGGAVTRDEPDVNRRKFSWSEKNRAVGRMFLEHALLVSDVMVALELACRERGLRLLAERELVRKPNQRFAWKVNVSQGLKLGVVPDRVFAIESRDANGKMNRLYFFLEADRGTMPVIRRKLFQTSFYRKLLAYEATWSQRIHEKRFGFNRFRVLTVTTGAPRINSLLAACSKLERGQGLFLFTQLNSIQPPTAILYPVWHSSKTPGLTALLP